MRGIVRTPIVWGLIGATLILGAGAAAGAATPAANAPPTNSPAAVLAGGYTCYAHNGAYSCFLPSARVSPSLRCYRGESSDSYSCYAKSALVGASLACFRFGPDASYYLCRDRSARSPVSAVPADFQCAQGGEGYVECSPVPATPAPPAPPTQTTSMPPHR